MLKTSFARALLAALLVTAAPLIAEQGAANALSESTISLSASSYSVAQTAGSLKISVTRTGPVGVATSSLYSTMHVTADNNVDYSKTTGTLVWKAGESTTKTISIPISAKTPFTGQKTFTINLLTASDAHIDIRTATVTIKGSGASTSTSNGALSLPGGSANQSGATASSGTPSSTNFGGLIARTDAAAHTPVHGAFAAAGTMPNALATESLPHLDNIKTIARRDTVILYYQSVAKAADYRAYAVPTAGFSGGKGVTFVNTANGVQPRGAVISCAGYRQHSYESPLVNGQHSHELQQAIELPGFTADGNYTIILEAVESPCPFVGMPANTDAVITSHFAESSLYKNTDLHAAFVSFDTVRKQFGNEILNGMGADSSWTARLTEPMGKPVAANGNGSYITLPGDPVVLARSAIAIQVPGVDEAVNAPTIDINNAVTEDFSDDLVVAPSAMSVNPDYGAGQALAPLATIPGKWQFWGRYMQFADGEDLVKSNNAQAWRSTGYKGFQVFQRHGRLYTTFGDAGQDIGGTMSFSSLKNLPLAVDDTKYAHSMWRANSNASHRRYWTWVICGASSRDQLVDTSTHIPKIRPIVTEAAFSAGGDNPTAQLGPKQAYAAPKECLSIIQDGRPEAARTDGNVRASGRITAQIYPAGVAKGVIALGNKHTDFPAPNGGTQLGFRYKTDASGAYKGPLIEPFDQASPLTHYDVFLRKDRLVVFINGRQGFCVDLSSRPLTMDYGMVSYGSLLYHSALEWQEVSTPKEALYNQLLNQPIATSGVWDAIYESDGHADIPSQFATYNPAACFKPATTALQ